jgi:hypothetical protein
MQPVVSITDHTDFLDRLGPSLPTELGRLERADDGGAVAASSTIVLRFTYLDVPFSGRVERQGSETILHLTGAIGPLPFSAQAVRRRARALRTLAAASRCTTLDWRVSVAQEISVAGAIPLAHPMTPVAMVVGAVQLLLRGEGYLSLLLDVVGDADSLNSSQAA